MSFWDTTKQLGGSIINLINSGAIKADELTRRQLKRMSDAELLSLKEKQPSNKYVIEEAERRGL